jgi:hypothetical protein
LGEEAVEVGRGEGGVEGGGDVVGGAWGGGFVYCVMDVSSWSGMSWLVECKARVVKERFWGRRGVEGR